MTTPQTSYLVTKGTEQVGPYTVGQIKSMWDSGVLTADALAWDEATQSWMHVKTLGESLWGWSDGHKQSERKELLPHEAESPRGLSKPKSRGFLYGMGVLCLFIMIAGKGCIVETLKPTQTESEPQKIDLSKPIFQQILERDKR